MKIAIIGTSVGQLALYKKAKLKGLDVVSFSWNRGVVPDDLIGDYNCVSVKDVDEIIRICREKKVDGVVTNGTMMLTEIVCRIAKKLDLIANEYDVVHRARDKHFVRQCTNGINGLLPVRCDIYDGDNAFYPCIVKPISGGSKKGVSIARTEQELAEALSYAEKENAQVLLETYIEGREVSVETISYKGAHYVVQITDKVSDGAPHFVELAHHQPSNLPEEIKNKIRKVIPKILSRIGFENGATHTEMKITDKGDVALIEVNARGGGDEISSTLTELSTGYDYVGSMIDVALGTFMPPVIHDKAYSGICFICEQTKSWVPLFDSADSQEWFVRKEITADWRDADSGGLIVATGNTTRNGYFIYKTQVPTCALFSQIGRRA